MGRGGFEQALERVGVVYQANVASTGRGNGYQFSMSADAQGNPVWFKALHVQRVDDAARTTRDAQREVGVAERDGGSSR